MNGREKSMKKLSEKKKRKIFCVLLDPLGLNELVRVQRGIKKSLIVVVTFFEV